MKSYLIFGDNARGPIPEIYVEPFYIMGDSVHVINCKVSQKFWPTMLYINAIGYEYLSIKSIRIRDEEQLAVDAVPAIIFSPQSFGTRLVLDWLRPDEYISITVRNYSPDNKLIAVWMSGNSGETV